MVPVAAGDGRVVGMGLARTAGRGCVEIEELAMQKKREERQGDTQNGEGKKGACLYVSVCVLYATVSSSNSHVFMSRLCVCVRASRITSVSSEWEKPSL